MRGFQTIVAHRAARRKAEVHDRGPALQFVMAVAVEQIRRADGNTGSRSLDRRKRRVIVHNFIGKQDFLVAAPPQVQR